MEGLLCSCKNMISECNKTFNILQLLWSFTFICENSQNTNHNLNTFHASGLFLYSMKTSENQRFSNIFRGHRNRRVRWNELKVLETFIAFLRHYKIRVYQRWKSSCTYQELKNVGLSEKFAYALNGRSSVLIKITQSAITCSKVTIETLEQGLKSVQN